LCREYIRSPAAVNFMLLSTASGCCAKRTQMGPTHGSVCKFCAEPFVGWWWGLGGFIVP
jgi:hypothetical protein